MTTGSDTGSNQSDTSAGAHAVATGRRLAKRVLLIGWDAADWQIINPLLDSGQMPTLERFLNAGVMGNLATLEPILSPMLWNSIATGKRPHKHGIHGFLEVSPDATGVRPVSSASRRTKALWNILTQQGLKTHVFGWFASHPAEPINGVCVSDQYRQAVAGSGPDQEWPLPAGSVHPPRLAETLAGLRVHPGEIEAAHLLPFMPELLTVTGEERPERAGLHAAVKLLADCASIHAAATWTLEHEPWDFAAVYYDAIDHFGHGFMQFRPPRVPTVNERQFELYRGVMDGVYRFHDMMLERLLQLAGEDATVLLVSDHGFYNDHLRPQGVGKHAPGPVAWHRPLGVFAMRGPGVRADERVYGSSLLDIAPTVLTLFGLPTGADMDGRTIAQAFIEPPAVGVIPSWDDVPGEAGMVSREHGAPEDPEAARQALQQLVDLGYIDPLSQDVDKQITDVQRELRFNLALSYLDAGLPAETIPLARALVEKFRERRFHMTLAQACLATGRLEEARQALEPVMAELAAGQDVAAQDASESEKAAATGKSTPPAAEFLLGVLASAEGRYEDSLEHFLRAEAAQPRLPKLHNQLGFAYLRRRLWGDAERAFRKALANSGDNARTCHGLSVALLRQGQLAEAAELSLRAVGLKHFFPAAHFQLGLTLARLNWPERAAQAFETGISMRPNSVSAHRYLARIYTRLGQSTKARAHRERAASLGPPVESGVIA